jgi:4-hydroxyphenylpyruvate dioxygenase
MQRKCIATVALSGTLPDKLEAAASVGFDGVEIMEADLLTFNGSPADVRRICEELDLTIELYQPFRDFEAMAEPQRARNLDRAERKFDVMQALGTELVLVCSNTQAAASDDDARAAADLAEMAERAARRGLRVGYEALSWGRHVKTWGHAWRIVQLAAHPAAGLIVDSFHTLALGDDPSGIADVPADKLFFVQLADAPRLSMDVLSWSRHFRNFPGQGDLDVVGFLRAVLASGYRRPLSLEVFNDEFRAAPGRFVARDGLRSLILAEAQALGGDGLPAVPALDGVEFLEFAVDEHAGPALARFLQTLGFHHAGRHRSKAVDLYRHGGVNLVLNAEQDSAAAEHFQLHGPSVCAMAIRVDDAARTVARAQALLCPDWQEQVGSGERRIPAVRAPDGTLIYLVEGNRRAVGAGDRRPQLLGR